MKGSLVLIALFFLVVGVYTAMESVVNPQHHSRLYVWGGRLIGASYVAGAWLFFAYFIGASVKW